MLKHGRANGGAGRGRRVAGGSGAWESGGFDNRRAVGYHRDCQRRADVEWGGGVARIKS